MTSLSMRSSARSPRSKPVQRDGIVRKRREQRNPHALVGNSKRPASGTLTATRNHAEAIAARLRAASVADRDELATDADIRTLRGELRIVRRAGVEVDRGRFASAAARRAVRMGFGFRRRRCWLSGFERVGE